MAPPHGREQNFFLPSLGSLFSGAYNARITPPADITIQRKSQHPVFMRDMLRRVGFNELLGVAVSSIKLLAIEIFPLPAATRLGQTTPPDINNLRRFHLRLEYPHPLRHPHPARHDKFYATPMMPDNLHYARRQQILPLSLSVFS